MNQEMGQVTNWHYFKQWLAAMPSTTRLRWLVVLVVLAIVWLAGASSAASEVAGIARLAGPLRSVMALSMGGFGFLWELLKGTGAIQETALEPNILWMPLAFALPILTGGILWLLAQTPNPQFVLRKKIEAFDRSQGRVPEKEVAGELAVRQGVSFAWVGREKEAVRVGLDEATGEGHIMVVGPTRSGKGLHLSDTLLTWRGPALVVDPKREQLKRTAAYRSQFGPVYVLPGHQVNLADYYSRLRDRDDIAELHTHFLRPSDSREPIFAEKARALLTASGYFGEDKGLDPVRVLLDLGESDLVEALTAMERVAAARRHVRVFTNGASPEDCREDKFVTSAFGNFTTRLDGYQKHIDTICPTDPGKVIPPDWAGQNATIYITYSLQDLQGVGGVVAAVIAAMLRYQMQRERQERLLVAIDELPAVGLRNISSYLATCGGYGITLLLYAQSVSQLTGIYGQDETGAILSNCVHQVWYPPADYQTAEAMSRLYGLTLRANPMHSTSRGSRQHKDREGQSSVQTNSHQGASWSWQERPAMLPNQMMALPAEQVLVSTLAGKRYVFLGRRLNPIPLFDRLPDEAVLRLPRPQYGERVYTPWTADDQVEDEAVTETQSPADDDSSGTAEMPDEQQSGADDAETGPEPPRSGEDAF